MSNRLSKEISPYLLQHQENPVDWHPWGAEAFETAKRESKPVFLSIGYSTCHWCHVMAHESFENPEIAGIMNEYFVNIKVDREERPDVDRLYMAFVQATTGSGGWPMSVWLTPEGRPFFGGTYFPPSDRYGRPGFVTVLERIAEVWARDRHQVEEQSERVIAGLRELSNTQRASILNVPDSLARGYDQFARSYDDAYGGFDGGPKFPRPSVLSFLFRIHARNNQPTSQRSLAIALHTLRAMAAGGIHDHLGGGFHRYSVDGQWHVPHFEKMLYDQAQLASSYVEAYQVTRDEAFAETAHKTLAYVSRDMRHAEGAFFSAEDADSLFEHGKPEHGEGAFYVWTRSEIESALGTDDARILCRHYGIERAGNAPTAGDPHGEFRGKNILIERQSVSDTARILRADEEAVRASLDRSRQILFDLRRNRPRPHLDDKILAAWNGLAISAFARAAAAFENQAYLDYAAAAARFLHARLYDESTGELQRSWRNGPGGIRGFAEDYAALIQGLLDLYEAGFDPRWLAWAIQLQGKQDALFWDDQGGGYFGSTGDDPLIAVRLKDDYDGAEPSANSTSATNLTRLARMLHDNEFDVKARKILIANSGTLERMPSVVPQMLVALDFHDSPARQLVIAGRPDAIDTLALLRAVRRSYSPNQVVLLADGADGQQILAAKSKAVASMRPIHGKAALYVCENFVCQAPITEPDDIERALRR